MCRFMEQQLLLGSYTKKKSDGIYQIQFNPETKKIKDLKLIISEDNPTYLAKSLNNIIYTVTKEGDDGGIAAYRQSEDGSYTLLNRVVKKGAPPCYVAVDENKQLVLAANYHKGEITTYKIADDGKITLADQIVHTGQGPHENQGSAHAHYADLAPDDRLVACDLGTDEVYVYDISEDGKLSEVSRYKAAPGFGPRHLVFHPNQKIAYLFGELSSTIAVLRYQEDGSFEHLHSCSTLPEGFTAFNGGAALRVSSDGRFLYASNRGHNSLVVYALHEEGKQMQTIQHISSEGDFPRDFNFDATEKFIILANQNTDNLTLYERNLETGLLDMIEKDIYAPECVCILHA